ncbi:hypothetical protein M422DRAFT_251930 [Sphaerobolus stellatus SS14]|uniref:Uncharacterized protein n=1 Tax=Sphaerobolus stellatus (strain SS14) TaxID=990650 RepID=A0A0C9VQM8_SPHS4|nr:hypothetical protein M422DRAFT_251930 [Sphaerobolus stellatus SS14]
MAPKKRTVDKVPAGTGDATDSDSTPDVIGGNDPTMEPGMDPSKTASATSEANTIHPTTRNTCATDKLAQLASERGTSEDPTQTPNPHDGSRDPLLPKTYSDYAEPNPEELALGDQIQEMLNTFNKHMDEVNSIHNMSHQAAQLLDKTNKSNTIAKGKASLHPRNPHKDPYNEDIDPHPEQPSNWLNIDEESMTGQHNIDPELIQSTDGSNNRSNPKQALGKARTKLLAKTAILERLYADQAPADHLNQVATAAQSTRMEYERLLRLSKAGSLNPQD